MYVFPSEMLNQPAKFTWKPSPSSSRCVSMISFNVCFKIFNFPVISGDFSFVFFEANKVPSDFDRFFIREFICLIYLCLRVFTRPYSTNTQNRSTLVIWIFICVRNQWQIVADLKLARSHRPPRRLRPVREWFSETKTTFLGQDIAILERVVNASLYSRNACSRVWTWTWNGTCSISVAMRWELTHS
jgi:hypothetical protein